VTSPVPATTPTNSQPPIDVNARSSCSTASPSTYPAPIQQALQENAATASSRTNRDHLMLPEPMTAGPTERMPYRKRTPITALLGNRSTSTCARATDGASPGNRFSSAGPSSRRADGNQQRRAQVTAMSGQPRENQEGFALEQRADKGGGIPVFCYERRELGGHRSLPGCRDEIAGRRLACIKPAARCTVVAAQRLHAARSPVAYALSALRRVRSGPGAGEVAIGPGTPVCATRLLQSWSPTCGVYLRSWGPLS
jgi:hypothetical protein